MPQRPAALRVLQRLSSEIVGHQQAKRGNTTALLVSLAAAVVGLLLVATVPVSICCLTVFAVGSAAGGAGSWRTLLHSRASRLWQD